MKRNPLYIYTALAVAFVTGGCADDTFDFIKGNDADREVILNLRLPAFTAPATRSADADLIENVRIYFLNSGDSEIGKPLDIQNVPASHKIPVVMPAGTESIKVIANYPGKEKETDFVVAYSAVNPNHDAATSLIFYGVATRTSLQSDEPTIDLYRSCAKTYFTVADGVNVSEFIFYKNPDKGYIVYDELDTPTLPSGLNYTETGISHSASETEPFFHYEAAKGNCFWVIKASYDNNDYYYKVGYILNEDETANDDEHRKEGSKGNEVDIVRNHAYVFTITNINVPGFSSPEAAANSDVYENRIEVEMKNYSETIFDMIACRDYYLGVQDAVTCNATPPAGESLYAKFEVVTNYKDDFSSYNISFIDGVDFIDEDRDGGILVTKSKRSDIGDSAGQQYTVQIPMLNNEYSNDERVVNVRIKVGDLYRDVVITQKGMDFLDPNSGILPVGIVTSGSNPAAGHSLTNFGTLPVTVTVTPYDYLSFLRQNLHGVTKEEMGVRRDNGLHFQIYSEADKQYEYYIDLGTEILINTTVAYQNNADRELFTVTLEDGSGTTPHKYAHVKLTPEGNKNYDIWTSKFTLKTSGRDVVYEIYHTGVMHELVNGSRQLANPDGDKAEGWFYYEQVDVIGSDGELYHILDRNLGASSNKSYAEGGAFASQNVGARGGYFILPETKDGSSPLAAAGFLPAGFDMPEVYHISSPDDEHLTLTNMGLKVENGIPTWRTTGASKISRIYLPIAGYMEDRNAMNITHAQIWSRDVLKGNQGFSEESSEFGKWFRYLDISGQYPTVQNSRIKNRGTDADIAMGVRLMKAPSAPAGWSLPNMATNRARLILYNEAEWTEAVAYCTGGEKGEYIVGMKKGDNAGTWYYVDLPYVPSNVQFANEANEATQPESVHSGVNEYHNSATGNNAPDFVTIYCQNNAAWSGLYIHYWDTNDTPYTNWNGSPQMVKVTYNGEQNWWRYYVPTSTKGVIVKNVSDGEKDGKKIQREIISYISSKKYIIELKNDNADYIAAKSRNGSTGGDDPSNEFYAIKGNFQADNIDANWKSGFKEFTYSSSNGTWELELNITNEGEFCIQHKTSNETWSNDHDWGNSNYNDRNIVDVTRGVTYGIWERRGSGYNWKFPSKGKYKLILDVSSSNKTLTVTFPAVSKYQIYGNFGNGWSGTPMTNSNGIWTCSITPSKNEDHYFGIKRTEGTSEDQKDWIFGEKNNSLILGTSIKAIVEGDNSNGENWKVNGTDKLKFTFDPLEMTLLVTKEQ